MERIIKALLLASWLLSGCAAKPQLPGSAQVMLSSEPVPAGCRYLGEVSGSQGNFWTAEFTSDQDLIQGARNEMRNAAHTMRANFVHIQTESYSHNTSDDSLGGTYSVVVIGNAYRCPDSTLLVR